MSRWCNECANKEYPSCNENCIIFSKGFEELAKLCFELQLNKPKWISCNERLPLEEGGYIVSCVNDNEYEFVSDDYFYLSDNEEKGFFEAYGRSVVAWMEYPQLYKEETK